MNAAHWHLALNHIPVVGTPFAVLLLGFALWKKRGELLGVCLGAMVLLAVLTAPAYFTGERAENYLMEETKVEVDESLVHPHEEAAEIAFIGIGVIGVIALGGLIAGRKATHPPRAVAGVVLILAIVECALLARAANLGGAIRHTEIRPAAGQPAPKTGSE
jgi:hypothetical protein